MAELLRPELAGRFGNDPDALEWARWHVQKQIDWLNEAAALPQASDGFAQIATWCAGFMRDTLIGNRLGHGAFDERFAAGDPLHADGPAGHSSERASGRD